MAEVIVTYTPDAVLNQLQSQRAKMDGYASNTSTLLELIGDLAESLIGTEGTQQVEAAKASAKTLLELEAEAKAYSAAIEAVRSQYAPSERITNFKKDLDQHAKRMLSTRRKQPEECEAYQDLCSKLCGEEEEEEEEEVDGDDEIRMTRGTVNAFCPLSGKPTLLHCICILELVHLAEEPKPKGSRWVTSQRLEIEDPVEDQMGYVYEKSAIHQYIQQHRGSVTCPAANHMVTMNDLKKASKLIREQKKHRQGSQYGTQKQSQAEVVDVD